MGILSFLYVVIFALVYFFCPEQLQVSQNKLDTLYMVSTIFFSAVIGMVISNSVHLEYSTNKASIRKLNNKMRNGLTLCFASETIAYFFYAENFSHAFSVHMHLIVLGLICYATIMYVAAMPIISHKIADIEDKDYKEQDEDKFNAETQGYTTRILDFCKKPRTISAIFRKIQVDETEENRKRLLDPLIKERKLFEMRDDKELQPSLCTVDYLREKIIDACSDEPMKPLDISVKSGINNIETVSFIVKSLVKDKLLKETVDDEDTVWYEKFSDEGYWDIERRIKEMCAEEPYTSGQILWRMRINRSNANFDLYIKPLIDHHYIIETVDPKTKKTKYKANPLYLNTQGLTQPVREIKDKQ